MANAWILKPLPIASVSASSAASGYPASNVANDYMGVVWRSATGAASRTLTVNFPSSVQFDTAMLLGCTGATSGWTLAVDAGGGTNAFLAGSAMPVSGRGRALWSLPSPVTAASATFTFGGLSSLAASCARVVIGKRIELARNFAFGAAFGVRELGGFDFSQRGVPYWRRGAKRRAIGVSFPHAYRDEIEAAIHPLLEELGGEGPVGLIIDPAAHAQRQNRMWFGPMTGDLGTIWTKANGFEWRCNIADLGS